MRKLITLRSFVSRALAAAALIGLSVGADAQPWIYDFGTGTGTANNANAGSGNTTFFPSTPAGGGTYRIRIGSQGGSLVLANPGTSLGTLTEAQLAAATGTSTNKFSVYGWTSPSTVAYAKFKMRTTSAGSGQIYFQMGSGTGVYADNNGAASYNLSVPCILITYSGGSITSVERRTSGAFTAIASSGFAKDTDQNIQVYASNNAATRTYYVGATAYTLNAQSWDLWVAGTKVSPAGGWVRAGTWASGANIDGILFAGENSASNSAVTYLDDLEYSNSFPGPPTPTITTISPTNATAGGAGFTLTVNGTNFVTGLSTVNWNGSPRTTTFVNSTQLTATIASGDIASPGTANVTVVTTGAASPSNTATFTINAGGTPNVTSTALTAFGAQCINSGPYGPNTFTISGTDLTTADVTVAALSGFEYSATGGAPYFSSLSLTQGGGTYGPVTINVRFNPTAVIDYSGNIVIGGGGASNINRAASGSGVNTAPVVTTGAASAITINSATVAGQLNTAGACGTVTAYGIEYSTSMGFTPGTGTPVASTNLSGVNYSSALSGLSPCTTYYMRAYATRASGTTYGSEGTFATLNLSAPSANSGTAVTSSSFTANWGTVSGATGYRLDVYTKNITLAADLFFSEYVEGSGNNKYLEIFNATGATVTLSDYEIQVFTNGSPTVSGTLSLTGTLANNSTIVYENPSATIYGGTTTSSGVLNYNGNDAMALYKVSTTSYVDIIGEIGNNPGTEWVSGGHSTLDKTLRRKSTVTAGITTNPSGMGFATMVSEWDVFAQNTVSDLGAHTYSGISFNYLVGYTDLSVAGTSQSVTGLSSNTNYYYVVRATAGACTSANSTEIQVLTLSVSDYYSQSSGDVEDPIWSETPVGTPGPAFFTSSTNMNVQAGHVVTNVNSVTLGDVNVEGTLVLATGSSLTINGDELFVIGTLTADDNSLVELFGEDVTVSVLGTPSFYDITVNNSTIVTVEDPIAIRGTLYVEAGEFETIATGGVIMQSDINGTGRLGPVGGVFTGDITMQRYIPAGATNWRLMGSPVAGQTVNEWKDDFITAGFPGSDAPTFDSPLGSGNLWPSVRWYDESLAFADIDTGWVGVSSIAQSLVQGQGFAAWCGTSLLTTTAFTVDMVGAPYIANTPIDVALSYTDNAAPSVDGWNAASNPLPSPILFSNIDRTNVDDYVWYYNPANGNTAVYDISLEAGTNGGTDTIQSSQAFLVKANAASAQLSFEEGDKVAQRAGGFFGGDQVSSFAGVRLKVTSGLNIFNDETLVIFNVGSADLDGEDVPKMTFAHPDAPQIATMAPSGELIAISAFGEYTTDITIPVMVDVALSGTYTVTASNMENLGLSCLVLEDLLTGTMTPLTDGASYSFAINANDANTEARLLLHASAPVPFYADAARCFGTDGAGSIIHVGTEPMDITWFNASNEVILQQTITEGVAINDQLPAGEYTVRVSSTAGCGALDHAFRIEQPAAMEALTYLVDATCPDMEDGLVDIDVLGGTSPFTYAWSNGSTEEDLVALPGTYSVAVTDANDCAFAAGSFVIGAGEAPVASASVESTTVLVDAPVFFDNASGEVETYFWEFGDGTTSDEATPTHSWSETGTYTVTLTVSNGVCSSVWSTDMSVELSTGMVNATATAGLNAWYANDKFIVAHGFDNGLKVVIDVFDATGRLHTTRVTPGSPARVSIPTDGLNNGIWFLRITNGTDQRTIRVPLVR